MRENLKLINRAVQSMKKHAFLAHSNHMQFKNLYESLKISFQWFQFECTYFLHILATFLNAYIFFNFSVFFLP